MTRKLKYLADERYQTSLITVTPNIHTFFDHRPDLNVLPPSTLEIKHV